MTPIPSTGILTANGEYSFPTAKGRKHLLILQGNFSGGAVKLQVLHETRKDYVDVTDGSFTAYAEVLFVAPSDKAALVLSGAGAPDIAVSVTPVTE